MGKILLPFGEYKPQDAYLVSNKGVGLVTQKPAVALVSDHIRGTPIQARLPLVLVVTTAGSIHRPATIFQFALIPLV